jgi:aryl-alcohol dehydrogenase-like predicted oxidoreductase
MVLSQQDRTTTFKDDLIRMNKTNMEYRKSKRFDKPISRIGFGAWQLGNNQDFSGMSEKEGIKLVKKAVDAGITFFDTAPNYAGGKSEKILGKALEGLESDIFINTKTGHHPNGNIDFSIDSITKSIYRSIDALNRDKLDSVILHNPVQEVLKGETEHYSRLISLKKEGVIGGYGVSIDTPEELKWVLDSSDVDVIEIMFNIIHQSPKVWFDEVRKRGILLIVKIPFDSGWLTGKYDRNSKFEGIRSRWTSEDIELRAELIEEIKDIVGTDDLVPLALSFILSFDAVTTVIPGIRNKRQLQSNVDSLNHPLNNEMKKKLEDYYQSRLSGLEIPW